MAECFKQLSKDNYYSTVKIWQISINSL